MEKIEELERAIAALESQRSMLGDSVVDLAQGTLREKLASLHSPPAAPEQQRKLLTVLFADIVGSTQVGKDRDPEQLLEIMDGALQALAKPVARRHGRVTRFMGDGFIAFFGLPLAYEDDAERAVLAGLEILQVARRVSTDLSEKYRISGFDVRIGINSGLVATGGFSEAEDTVMGLTVNLAQRLESAAPAGGLLISQSTHRLVEGLFTLRPVEPVAAKGFDQAVPAFLVQGSLPRTDHTQSLQSQGFEYHLVGRDAELSALQGAFHAIVRESRCRVVALVGDPGMGKRRLQNELVEWIKRQDDQVVTFHGRAQPVGSPAPYSLLRDLFSNRFDISDDNPVGVVRQKIESGFGQSLGDEAQMKAHWIAALLGFELGDSPFLVGVKSDPDQLRQRALHYLEEYISNIASTSPVVITLEDLHTADRPSLLAMSELVCQLTGKSLLVLCLARPALEELLAEFKGTLLADKVGWMRLDLSPLSPEASQQLVRSILRSTEIPQQLVDVVANASAGNPYYIAELVKILIEDGVISISGDGRECQVDALRLDRLRVPATLTALIQARLDSLPEEEKVLLQRASVIGEVFWDGALQSLEIPSHRASTILTTLSQRGLVQSRTASQFDTLKEYAFASSILREVVYETVLLRNRHLHHRQVGDWLASVSLQTGRQAEYAALIARHYDLAGQDRQAAYWYLTAGERSKQQSAFLEARRFFDLALERIAADDLENRWQIISNRSEVLAILGDHPARTADDAVLLALAQELNDDDRLADAYFRKGSFASTTGDDRQAVEDFEGSLQAARRAGNRDLQANLLSMQAISLFRLGNHRQAELAAEQVLLLAKEVQDEVTQARIFTNLSTFYAEAGDIVRAIDLIVELVEITRRLDERLGLAINLSNLGYNRLRLGLYAAGLHSLGESLSVSESIGARHLNAFTRLNYGLACLLVGDLSQARQALEQSLRELVIIQDQFGQAAGWLYLGRLYEEEGEFALAQGHYNQALECFEKSALPEYACDARAGLARCHLRQGKITQAATITRQVWAALGEQEGKGMEFPILAYHTCAQVFISGQEYTAAKEVLTTGRRVLVESASRIKDPAWRAIYLEQVAENRALIENWQKYSQEE